MKSYTRRDALGVLGAGAISAGLPLGAWAQNPERLNVLSHTVHRTVATGKQAGDVTAEWAKRSGVGVNWITFDMGPLKERLLREASLGETTIDIAYVLNAWATPAVASLFEPLDDYLKAEAIEDFGDIFPGMVSGMRFGGRLYGIPVRHATSGLHYNEELLAERGLSGPPRSIEEFVDYAKKLSYKRADGTQVTGFAINGVHYANVVDIARAWNGDFITPEFKVTAAEPPMVRAIALLRDLYSAGAFPRGFATLGTEDVNTLMQTGRAAMTMTSWSRTSLYNDPARSKFPGKVKVTTIPVSSELRGKFDAAPAKVEFWAMAIPKSSKHKKLAWGLIREMSSKQATLNAAINGNGPVRASTYANPAFSGKLPYAAEELRVLKLARIPMPAFDNAQKAADHFKEEVEAAVLGHKTPQKAMEDLAARVAPLVPRG